MFFYAMAEGLQKEGLIDAAQASRLREQGEREAASFSIERRGDHCRLRVGDVAGASVWHDRLRFDCQR